METCQHTTDPNNADLFLVPFFFGTMMTLGWQVKNMPGNERSMHREMMRSAIAIGKNLTHLNNQTASRHLFLFSCDSQFVGVGLNPLMSSSIVLHLGDDDYSGSVHDLRLAANRDKHRLRHGLTVPYRVSQWLPFGFKAPAVGPRRLLASMNANMKRAGVRGEIAGKLRAASKLVNVPDDRVLITEHMNGPAEAAQIALSSTFCLCPTGDSKGFTARFYFALLHGCLPVRVDGYRRDERVAPPAYPFPLLINWSKIVVDVPPKDASTRLAELLQMPSREIEERQSYLRHVAHFLVYDSREHAHHDAPAALIHALETKVLPPRGSGSQRGVARSRLATDVAVVVRIRL